MGCDIHCYTETRNTASGHWHLHGDLVNDNEDYPDEEAYWDVPSDQRHYSGRNYGLFAILADVRNYAGVKPIAPERGVPADASDGYNTLVSQWEGDGHSHSYFTLAELLAHDWSQVAYHETGTVPAKYWLDRHEGGEPKGPHYGSRAADLAGNSRLSVVGRDSMELIAHAMQHNPELVEKHEKTVAEDTWSVTYASAASHFYDKTLPALQTLASEYGLSHDDVRIVFFFDN